MSLTVNSGHFLEGGFPNTKLLLLGGHVHVTDATDQWFDWNLQTSLHDMFRHVPLLLSLLFSPIMSIWNYQIASKQLQRDLSHFELSFCLHPRIKSHVC